MMNDEWCRTSPILTYMIPMKQGVHFPWKLLNVWLGNINLDFAITTFLPISCKVCFSKEKRIGKVHCNGGLSLSSPFPLLLFHLAALSLNAGIIRKKGNFSPATAFVQTPCKTQFPRTCHLRHYVEGWILHQCGNYFVACWKREILVTIIN